MRRIKVSFVDENVEALAVLLDEQAPSTNCIWNALETLEGLCITPCGQQEISFPFPGTAFHGMKG